MSNPFRDANKVNPIPLGAPKKPNRMLNNQTSNASSASFPWAGGIGTFVAQGTFGSGTCKLQASFDGGNTWHDVGLYTTFTANGIGNFELADCLIRANLSGATNPVITAYVSRTA